MKNSMFNSDEYIFQKEENEDEILNDFKICDNLISQIQLNLDEIDAKGMKKKNKNNSNNNNECEKNQSNFDGFENITHTFIQKEMEEENTCNKKMKDYLTKNKNNFEQLKTIKDDLINLYKKLDKEKLVNLQKQIVSIRKETNKIKGKIDKLNYKKVVEGSSVKIY